MRASFPSPGHDHARCSAEVLSHAEALCRERKQRLTPMRRQVLNALASSHRPIGAYEIMDIVAADGSRPAPITVYRALDFLIEQGLVHRIESRNAFLACARRHESGAVVAFLICEKCGAVGEAPAGAIMQTVGAAAKSMGFTAKMSVIEITGLCAHCQSE
jgi:Fur family zinc uptake transcriptional regulator